MTNPINCNFFSENSHRYLPPRTVLLYGHRVTLLFNVLTVSSNLVETKFDDLPSSLLTTALTTAKLVGTNLMHPLGIVIDSAEQIITQGNTLYHAAMRGNALVAVKASANLTGHALLIGACVTGSFELFVTLYAIRILSNTGFTLYHLQREEWTECAPHAIDACISSFYGYRRLIASSPLS